MRVVGYEFSGAAGPVGQGFLPLGDVTVLFGENDVGKSRLLRSIASAAGSLDVLQQGGTLVGDHRIFLKLHQEDARRLLQRTWELHVEEMEAAGVDATEDYPDGEASWFEALPGVARDLDPLTSTFAFEALAEWCGQRAKQPGLLVSWCAKAEAMAGRYAFAADNRSVAMGTVDLPVLPVPVELPVRDVTWLRRQIANPVSELLAHLHWGHEALPALEQLMNGSPVADALDLWMNTADEFARKVEIQPSVRSLWTITDDATGAIRHHPMAVAACEYIGSIANSLAPTFVKNRYELRVTPTPLLDWHDEQPVAVSLRDASGSSYDLADVADGLTLWIQITLLEAADAIRRVELNLRNALLEIDAAFSPTAPADASLIEAYMAQLQSATYEANDPPFDRTLIATLSRAVGVASGWRDSFAGESQEPQEVARRIASARPRLYLLDEPERHLNPRLQRAAARWLVDLLLPRQSQAVIATHSHAFLSVGPEPLFIHVRRTPDRSSKLQPFEPQEITAWSDLAREVGLDRGELLTSCKLVVFVEGRHDQVVLDELFRLEHHHAGILVVPIAGVDNHAQIVEHDVLIRIITAPLAVVFDKTDRATITRLKTDAEFLQESLRSGPHEVRAMAALLHRAQMAGRDVEPTPLPVADIFDALDGGVLKDLYPRFPGHAEGDAAWLEVKPSRSFRDRKAFYEQRYGVPNSVETYRTVAAVMRSQGRIPNELRDLSADLERMAAADGS